MTSATSYDSHGHMLKMQLSGNIELASSTSGPVKWKAREVSASRDFPKSFQPAATHVTNPSEDQSMDSVDAVTVKKDPTSDRENGVELFEHNVGSQEKVVQVEKAVLKPHKVESEEVKPRVDSEKVEPVILGTELPSGLIDAANYLKVVDGENTEYGPLRIRLYPSPKRRKVPVFRDFPMALEQFGRQVDQEINKPSISEDEIESEESLMYGELGFPHDLEVESDRLESVHEFHDFPMAFEQVGRQVNQEINKPLAIGGEVDQEINKPLVLEDDIESNESLMNTEMLGLLGHLKVESNRLDSVGAHHQGETVKQETTDLTDSRSSTVVNIPRRRVSGVRCFPPGCGRDAAYLNKEDLEKALADSNNLYLSCEICTEEEEPFVEEEGEQEDDEVVVEEEEEEEVVEEEEEEEEVMMTDDKGGTMEAKFESQRAVVVALKASRSSCTQNARAKPTAGGELKEEEEIGTTDFKEEQRVVVQALMASTRCPWRNSKRGKCNK